MNTKDLGTSSGSLADGESRLAGTAQVGHTPGPWHHEPCGDWFNVSDAYGFSVAEAMVEADARLIAAAPELLEMTKLLEKVAKYQIRIARDAGDEEGARMTTVTLNMCRAAIAKAESP